MTSRSHATEMNAVSRICSPTFKLGNTSFPPKDTKNFRIPMVWSQPLHVYSTISSARRLSLPSISSGNATAKPAHFFCRSAKSLASAFMSVSVSSQTFHANNWAASRFQSGIYHSFCLLYCCKTCTCCHFSRHLFPFPRSTINLDVPILAFFHSFPAGHPNRSVLLELSWLPSDQPFWRARWTEQLTSALDKLKINIA